MYLTACLLRGLDHDSSVGESMYLTSTRNEFLKGEVRQ